MKKFKSASEIKVGVIGYGGAFNMGKAHLNEMKKAGMTPTAVAEIDKERLKVAETDFPGIPLGSVSLVFLLGRQRMDRLRMGRRPSMDPRTTVGHCSSQSPSPLS